MNTLHQPARASAAGTVIQPGIPFSTRMFCGAQSSRPPIMTGNRAFIRAWAAHHVATAAAPLRRAH